MVMPVQKPGKSKQDYGTPWDFFWSVERRLDDHFSWDLAASKENTKCPDHFFTKEDDSLSQRWHELAGWLWLNPPYADIRPWVRKAAEESQHGAKLCVLVPSSTGANWWRDYVDGVAYTTFLNGRITFEGTSDPYPKDLALLIYAPYLAGGSCVWRWL